jgi:hypothetical protein
MQVGRIIAVLLCLDVAAQAAGPPVEVGEIRFDPIGPGKNLLHIPLKNTSDVEQSIGINVVARSADGKNEWKGWIERGRGSMRFDRDGRFAKTKSVLDAHESLDATYQFQIPEPFGDRASITIQLYDFKDPKQKQLAERRKDFTPYLKKSFTVANLPRRKTDWLTLPAAPMAQSDAAKAAFAEAQLRLHLGLFHRASELFTQSFCDAEQAPTGRSFQKRLCAKDQAGHAWNLQAFLAFKPGDVRTSERGVVLFASSANGERRAVEMVDDNGSWKIDWIHAPMPAANVAGGK